MELIGSMMGFAAVVSLFWVPLLLLFCAATAGAAAKSKERDGFVWALLGLVFGPVALLALAAYAPPIARAASQQGRGGGDSPPVKPNWVYCAKCRGGMRSEEEACPRCGTPVSAAAS